MKWFIRLGNIIIKKKTFIPQDGNITTNRVSETFGGALHFKIHFKLLL